MALNALVASLMAIATAQVALAASVNYCYPPIGVEYGGYSPVETSYSTGSTIRYHCDEGYEIEGKSQAECIYDSSMDEARFSSPPPFCKRQFKCFHKYNAFYT